MAVGGGPQFTQTRQKLSIQGQARRRIFRCGFAFTTEPRLLAALEEGRVEDNVIAKLDSLVGSLFCAGPASEQAVMKAEVRLGLLFPPSYRAFLLHYGAAFGGGLEIYGLDSNLKLGEIPQWSNVVESTIALRPDSLPGDSIQISHSGMDSGFFLHCSRSIKNYEGHVIAWGPEHGSNGKKIFNSFQDWLLASNKSVHPVADASAD